MTSGMKTLTTAQVTYNLSGKVMHQGLPVAHVELRLFDVSEGYPGVRVGTVKTQPKGEYQFPVASGVYRLEVVPDDATSFVKQFINEINLAANSYCNINLITGVVLRGKVKCKSATNFEQSEIVVASTESNNGVLTSPIKRDGSFAMVLAKGPYIVGIRALSDNENNSAEIADGQVLTHAHQFIDLARDTNVIFDLPQLVLFKGQVKDTSGAPVVGAQVTVAPQTADENLQKLSVSARCATNASGGFSLPVEPGMYDISIASPEFSPLSDSRTEALVISHDCDLEFALEPGVRLSGQVMYELTQITNCLVSITNKAKNTNSVVQPNDRGQFVIGLPQGEYELKILPPSERSAAFKDWCYVAWSQNMSLQADQDLKIKLEKGFLLTGTVSDPEGKPRPHVKVSVFTCGADSEKPEPFASTTTDGEGNYRIILATGNYKICLHDEIANAEDLTVEKRDLEHNFVLQGMCVVRLKVVADDDKPLSRCKVIWEPYSATNDEEGEQLRLDIMPQVEEQVISSGFCLTDENGICEISVLAGIYTFQFEPSQQSNCQPRTIRQLSISQDLKRKVKLESN
jgi:hypothetical protein